MAEEISTKNLSSKEIEAVAEIKSKEEAPKEDSPIYRKAIDQRLTPEEQKELAEEIPKWSKERTTDIVTSGKVPENLTPMRQFEIENGCPLTIDHLGGQNIYKGWYKDEAMQSSEKNVRDIESCLMAEMERLNLKPSVSSAREILDKAEKALGMSENLDFFEKLSKIALYLNIRLKDHQIQKSESKLARLERKIEELKDGKKNNSRTI